MWKCNNCGHENGPYSDECKNCHSPKELSDAARKNRVANLTVEQAVSKRYWDAYLVARTINGYGISVKVAGILIGLVLLLGGIGLMAQENNRDPLFFLSIVCVAAGLFVGALFYLIGVLISAQGQILKAHLDSAVNTSPFLSDEHRAKIMSLN